jgi:hypothetical protein
VQREVTCRQFVGLIGRLRDGELSDVDRRSFLQHGQKCVRCSDYLKGYELTISATKRIADDAIDSAETIMPIMPKSLVNRILDSRLKNGSGS